MKILIVDDERPARRELIFLLSSLLPEAGFAEADDADSAMELIRGEQFCAAFLDINLGEIKGTLLASMLRECYKDIGIVFVTAYQDYAVKAFELDAVDYVMKPYDMKRLGKAVDKLKNQGYLTVLMNGADDVKEEMPFEETGKIAIHGADRIILVDINDIIMIQTNQRGCELYTKDHIYEENTTLNNLGKKLTGHSFYRIHKSYIVNLNYVEELLPSYNNGYAMRLKYYKKELIPISRSQVKNIRKMFTI